LRYLSNVKNFWRVVTGCEKDVSEARWIAKSFKNTKASSLKLKGDKKLFWEGIYSNTRKSIGFKFRTNLEKCFKTKNTQFTKLNLKSIRLICTAQNTNFRKDKIARVLISKIRKASRQEKKLKKSQKNLSFMGIIRIKAKMMMRVRLAIF